MTNGQLLENVGYSTNTAEAKSGEIIAQAGVQEELNRLGFTEDNANAVVGTILMNPKEQAKDRLKAAELVYKVKGSFVADQKTDAPSVVNIFNDANILLATKAYEESLKRIISNEPIETIPAQTETASDNQHVAIVGAVGSGG